MGSIVRLQQMDIEENVRDQKFDLFPRVSAWLRFMWATMFVATPIVHYPYSLSTSRPEGIERAVVLQLYATPIFCSPIFPGFCQDVPCPRHLPVTQTKVSLKPSVRVHWIKTSSVCLRGRRLPNQCLENTKVSLRSNQKIRKVKN